MVLLGVRGVYFGILEFSLGILEFNKLSLGILEFSLGILEFNKFSLGILEFGEILFGISKGTMLGLSPLEVRIYCASSKLSE